MDSIGSPASGSGHHPNRLLSFIVAGIVLVSLFVAFATSEKPPKKLSLDTPQGVVQSFLGAILDGKPEAASKFFSAGSDCRVVDVEHAYIVSTSRIALIKTHLYVNSATVEVSVEFSSGGLSMDAYHEEHTFRLTQKNNKWYLVGIPWPLYNCSSVQK